MSKLLYEELSYEVRGILMEVYNTLGPGFREETYKIATLDEAARRSVPMAKEMAIDLKYKGKVIDTYRLDSVIGGKIILELKAVEQLHHAIALNSYLI